METINYYIIGLVALNVALLVGGVMYATRKPTRVAQPVQVRANPKPTTTHIETSGTSRSASVNRPSKRHIRPESVVRPSKRHSLRDYERGQGYDDTDNPIVAAAVVAALDSDDYRPRHVDCTPAPTTTSESSSISSSSCSGYSSSSSDSGSSFSGGDF